MSKGLRIGSILGIEIVLGWSLPIAFFLVAFSLGAGGFPIWHPNWGGALIWVVALAAAALFLLSILVHELSHALVGRSLGVEIRRITLFVFGGMAQLEREPATWRAEFWMAIVGPITSLVIGIVCLLAGSAMIAGVGVDPSDPVSGLAAMSPMATIMLWLGPVNLMLAVFNLLPGFPLDGGRVLRAVLWGVSGDLYRATRWASRMGRGVGLVLIGLGISMLIGIPVPFFGKSVVGGLWFALIGWFLHNAASLSYQQLLAQRSLARVPVSRVMLSNVATVDPGLSIARFIDDYLIAHHQGSYPVVREGRLFGLVGFEQVRKLSPEARNGLTVAEVMTPAKELATVEPTTSITDALNTLFRRAVEQLLVVANGEVRGLLRREDILKWVALRGGEEEAPA